MKDSTPKRGRPALTDAERLHPFPLRLSDETMTKLTEVSRRRGYKPRAAIRVLIDEAHKALSKTETPEA